QQPAQSQPTVQSENEKGASHAHH
ncbi:hypothetical protein, partial [Acinetobacter baumannii]